MSQLDQFTETQTASVDDFLDTATPPPPVTSVGSNQNMAAHAALLSPTPEDAPQIYNQSNEEYALNGNSQTADAVIANAKGQNTMAYRRASAEFLTDPNAADEYKVAALAAINAPNSGLFNVRAMVATQEASKSNKGESTEAADLRGAWAAGINRVIGFQREKQKLFNEMQVRADSQKAAPYVSFAEDLVPVVSGYKTASLTNELSQGKGLSTFWGTLFPGAAKAEMRDNFNKIPYEERGRVMQKAMDIIANSGSTIVLPEEYDNVNRGIFTTMVEAGDYTATDETIDNIIGVLDVIGLGAFLKGATSPAKAAKEAETLGEAAMGGARRPTQETDWRTGGTREAGTFDQEGKPSSAVATASDEVIPYGEQRRNWQRQYITTDVQPTSPSQTIKDANPETARKIHNAVEEDPTGNLANASYGSSREDAIAHDITPQVGTVDGSVQSKIYHPEQESDFKFMPSAEVLDFVDNSGAAYLAPSEKRRLRSSVVNDFRNAVGMVNRKEMGSIEAIDDGVKFSAVYGPTDSGWSSMSEAMHQAQYALRNYGVVPEDIKVMVRVGEDYKPLSMDEATLLAESNPQIAGDFLLQINKEYKFDSANLERDGYESFDVHNNIIDQWFPGGGKSGSGTVQSNLLDAQSMLHPDFTKGATISGLRGAQLEQKLMEVVKPYIEAAKKLPIPRQNKIFAKIREANAKGESFNYANLRAEGFNGDEIHALEQWKVSQDTIYSLSNRDMIKSYRTRGYGLMEHSESGTRLIVKPVPRNQVTSDLKVFDPVSKEVKTLTNDELKALYDRNGGLAKTVNPMNIDGAVVEHVINNNAASSTYIRALNHTDTVLNYRKGYYAVKYQDPVFIERKVVDAAGEAILDAGGRVQWKAVATAANTPDAQRGMERLRSTSGGEYQMRSNLKGEDFERAESQRLQASGMSSQRVRGERLEEALGQSELSEFTNIESPINSLVHSIASVSHRISHRDWIETAKQRYLSQFGEVLPMVRGQTQYPATRAEIGLPGQKTSKMAGDARTTWEYIRQMENGYINSIDDGWKAALNAIADFTGSKGFGKSEELLRGVGNVGPTQLGKSTAFNLMLATNPLRQLIVQSHQMLMLGATFPKYTFNHMVDDLMFMMIHANGGIPSPALLKVAGRTLEETQEMWDALKASGISAGISKHEMVRQSLGSIADEAAKSRLRITQLNKLSAPVHATVGALRKVGFDFGEWLSSSASFLAHYDRAKVPGKKMGQEEIDTVTSRSRNYVYNMDQAGALPYNHNAAALIMQFLQAPHKALLQFTFNRGVSAAEKAKIATYMITMYGPISVIGIAPGVGNIFESYLAELLPDDSVARKVLLDGIESVLLNKLFSSIYGEEVNLDFSSLSPLDAYGLTEFVHNVLTEGPAQLVASSPAGSLLWGTNPRIMTLATTVARFVGLGGGEYDENPAKWSNVALDTANLFSGFSNAYKAAYALEYGRKLGALGGTTDSNVNSFEAIAQALGIPTQDETNTRKILDTTWKTQKAFEEDVKNVFNVTARQLTQDGITPEQFKYYTEMSRQAMAAFKGNPKAMEIWNKELRKQTTSKDYKVMNTILEQCGFAKPDDVKRLIDRTPNITADQKDNLRAICEINLNANKNNGSGY